MDSYQNLGHDNGSNTTYNYICSNEFTDNNIFCEWLDRSGEGKETIFHKCTAQNTTEMQVEPTAFATSLSAYTYRCTNNLTTIFMDNIVRPFNEFNLAVEYPSTMTNQSSTEKKSLLCSSSDNASGNHTECVLKFNAIDYLLSSYEGILDTNGTSLLQTSFSNSSTTKFSSDSISDILADNEIINITWTYLQMAIVIFFILIGGVGNALVCLAIVQEKKLHNTTNMFLFSLAIADLLVSLFVMPLGAIPAFLGYWPLGPVMCNVYVTCDVLACSSSILHMLFISYTRYTGIKDPIASLQSSSKKVVFIKIAWAWLMAMLVSSFITILGLYDVTNIMPQPDVCVINNKAFFVFGSAIAFYIPMIIMVWTYGLTVNYLKLKASFIDSENNEHTEYFRRKGKRIREYPLRSRSQQRNILSASVSQTNVSNNKYDQPLRAASVTNINQNKTSIQSISALSRSIYYVEDGERGERDRMFSKLRFLSTKKRQADSANMVATEQKATKVLGVVFFAFVMFWAPFFILNIFFAICPRCKVPARIVNICLWLGYFSSTINPIIYTIFNKTFRNAFKRILMFDCRKRTAPIYFTGYEGRSAMSLCAQSALPLAISFQGSQPIINTSKKTMGTHVTESSFGTNVPELKERPGVFSIQDDEC
ncbi:hypothetical protein ACFFRR_000902 [Megaselia abdita]